MSATTKYKIAEQVIDLIKGSTMGPADTPDIQAVMEMVCNVINAEIKAEFYGPHIQGGEVNPNGLVIGTYPDIDVEKIGNYSGITLPCMPVKLLMNQGLFSISKAGDLLGEYEFIPVPPGAWRLKSGFSLVSEYLNQICYVNEGLKVNFTKDIINSDGISKVDVKLVVVDASALDEFDPLPIAADMVANIVTKVYAIYSGQGMGDKSVDPAGEKMVAQKR